MKIELSCASEVQTADNCGKCDGPRILVRTMAETLTAYAVNTQLLTDTDGGSIECIVDCPGSGGDVPEGRLCQATGAALLRLADGTIVAETETHKLAPGDTLQA